MKKKERINQQVKETLNCFGQPNRLPANPYFFARVQEKIKQGNEKSRDAGGLFPVMRLRPILIGIIIILNLTTAVLVYLVDGVSASSRSDRLTTLAAEYGLNQEEADYLTSNK